jgi:hypothetical protein
MSATGARTCKPLGSSRSSDGTGLGRHRCLTGGLRDQAVAHYFAEGAQAAEEKWLRIEDDADKRAQYEQFVGDLKVCAKMLAKAA